MPITLNGSGSIEGISAGGLPDDCITTAEIAANAVTYAKIGTNVASGLCKAWVNFNGTSTVAIRASYNVSSISDNQAGDYTVNFATALVDANYSAVGCAGGPDPAYGDRQLSTYPTSASACRVISGVTASVTKYDAQQVHVAIFR